MDRRPPTILLLDDDPQFRALVAPVLERKGYRVLQAESGAQATAIVGGEHFDLIIVDGLLPDTDGISWIARLRKVANETPVVFVSAFWRDPSSIEHLTRDLAVSLVIHKPVHPADFGQQIESQLAGETQPVQDSLPESAEAAMAALRADYGRRLPEKVHRIAHAVEQARSHPDDSFLMTDARVQAHKLHGTAASVGFQEVGRAAGRIEDHLIALMAASHPDPKAAWDEIQGGVVELARTADYAARNVQAVTEPATATARILVVHHDPELVRQIEALGRQHEIAIVAATAAGEALGKARSLPPDGVLIDLELGPGELPFELARSLRALPDCETLPLGFLSAEAKVADTTLASYAGAIFVLPGPPTPEALFKAASELVAERRKEQPSVLVIDDDEAFCTLIAAILRKERMQVTAHQDSSTVLRVLEDRRPDLLLLDVILPGVSGFDVCRMLRTKARWQDLPVLFLTAKTGIESRIAAFEAGGDDYLAKPIVEEELLARIKVRLERARLIRERSDKDSLTELPLRRRFLEGLQAQLAEMERRRRPLTVCLLDLDYFKAINDQHGHDAGDKVLIALGKLLLRRFRREDLRARWGGEEFVLAFPDEPLEAATAMMDRLLGEFRCETFTGDQKEIFTATFSAGLAAFPTDGTAFQDLLRIADRRLYASKRAGRNRVSAKD